QEMPEDGPGRRAAVAQVRNSSQTPPAPVQMLYGPIQEYARAHGGIGPNAFTDLDRSQFGYALDYIGRSPWPEDAGRRLTGPFYFLVPATRLPVTLGPLAHAGRTPLVLELRPYLDDGKQWVLFSDASMERVPIDRALITKYQLTLSFVRKTEPSAIGATKVRYAATGLLKNSTAQTATLALVDPATSRHMEVR